MITKPVPALLCTPTGHGPTNRPTPELAQALELREATASNARSTVTFQTAVSDAKDLARQFGRSVTEDDFMNLDRFEVIMRLATTGGVSSR
ncbi:hypothetical protein SZN_16390 [Streptomyces zinciresistens K42]|uniref:Uncharacterized protein n=1 Tax=Streptomyces zinciresistens K42 TaxID=700597 RepID=G2GCQ3_9ACTN|nr:hypothetical protein [Streptomyces zinciresistens]EGX58714.1 hypothetical protein SZN_16390 [Streptomyces zinciresistens K42]